MEKVVLQLSTSQKRFKKSKQIRKTISKKNSKPKYCEKKSKLRFKKF